MALFYIDGNMKLIQGISLELKQLFEIQRNFDRKLGWNTYEKCQTNEDLLKFMEHFVLVMVEELGEISRIRKQYYRDNKISLLSSLSMNLWTFLFISYKHAWQQT